MPNEANKEDAERVKEMAKAHWKNKNYDRAEKLFNKSLSMYPLAGVEAMRDRMLREKGGASGAAQASAARARAASSARAAPKEAAAPTRPYTAEQTADVARIRRCGKNPYKILGVETTASDAEIKKAYRKLALKFHPDKNTAPGAEDAFKRIGSAFATLSDEDKRAHFDRFGEEAPENGGGGGGFRHRGGGMHEVDPDEIFRAFFGGGFPGHMHGGGARRQQRRPQQRQQEGGMAQLMQLLPLIVLFMLSFMSFDGESGGGRGGRNHQPFKLQCDSTYSVPRKTQYGNVRRGIDYCVKRDFQRTYGQQPHYLSRVEALVEQTYEGQVHNMCNLEKQQQRRLIVEAKKKKDKKARKLAMDRALKFEMKHCKNLDDASSGWSY